MFQDKSAHAIIDFALNQQEPYDALGSIIRAGKLASVYRSDGGSVNLDFNALFP